MKAGGIVWSRDDALGRRYIIIVFVCEHRHNVIIM